MDSENKQRCQTALYEEEVLARSTGFANSQGYGGMNQESLNPRKDQIQDSQASKILAQLHDKQLLIVNSRRRNGLILYKRHHAEFAGPGAAVGGVFDLDCQRVLPVGNLSLITPESPDERQRAYLIRRQWINLTKKITEKSVPLERAQMILNQFDNYFDSETIAQLPDEAFALLVGVLPHTIGKVRNTADRVDVIET
ncbi:hypothetical protein H6F98_28810 [Microcoleus sp. FACHB-SPT15]|jgi:hypothetical protein|uniref:hypothetical protein n=1 Tax=Microcoleus sp. FACHB-SPT15 TaxID=2692830 RepID=UPI0017840B01|nr:hypothetical protein [Microcoleus sp. FACHB-SPT15]MBD1809428.1 hypothetical protein [Microcoleus sp. FACHB-SPT15]